MNMLGKQTYLFIIFLILVVLAAGCNSDGGSSSAKKWTVMIYLDGDEISMEQDMVAAFKEMIEADVGSSGEVNIVVQFDRLASKITDFGDWTIAHRFYVTPGMEPTGENAIADWGDGKGGREVNMADPDTLLDFVTWSISSYPAEHYSLVIADHGYGWRGMATDTTSNGDFLELKELKEALNAVPDKIDLLALDACAMQMVEVAYELRDSGVGMMVGSELLGTTWPFAEILGELTISPQLQPLEFAQMINDLYVEAHADENVTLSTLDLSALDPLAQAVKAFAASQIEGLDDQATKAKALDVMEQVEKAVLYSKSNPDWEKYANGVTIYFPPFKKPCPEEINGKILGVGGEIPPEFFYFYTHQATSFSEETLWRDFLFLFYNMDTRINDAIFHARFNIDNDKRVIDETNVDLYDFCRRVVEHIDGN